MRTYLLYVSAYYCMRIGMRHSIIIPIILTLYIYIYVHIYVLILLYARGYEALYHSSSGPHILLYVCHSYYIYTIYINIYVHTYVCVLILLKYYYIYVLILLYARGYAARAIILPPVLILLYMCPHTTQTTMCPHTTTCVLIRMLMSADVC
jgi:hypothetical protein